MSSGSRKLMQEFHRKQDQLVSKLAVEYLPRQKDRILHLSWGNNALEYDNPRFGVLENQLADRSRGGWQVILAEDLQDSDSSILDWVLWRESLLSLLLPHLRHIPEAADLGLFAGLQFGGYNKSDHETLNTLWKQVSPPQHYQHYIYDAPFGFPLFEQVVAGTFLHRVIPWLNTFRPSTPRATFTTLTYTAALERWMLETDIPLTQPEHNILTALSTMSAPLHQSRLANQLNMSISGLSQHLNNLAQRHALRLNHFINLPLIGLTPYELLINTPSQNTSQKIAEIFSQIPFTWFINSIHPTYIHCRVLIPTTKESNFLNWLTALSKKYKLLPIEPIRTAEIIQTWNLDIYVPNQGWPDDLTFQLHQIQAVYNDEIDNPLSLASTSSMSYELMNTSQKYPIPLRSEDFTYFLRAADIHQITDRITPQASKELRQAGISESAHMVYRRRIRQLEEMKISSTKGMWMLHIGLDTIIQVYILEHRHTTMQLVTALQVLPRLNGLIFENGNGAVFIHTPNKLAVDVLSFLRKLFAQNDVNAVIIAKPAWQASSGFSSPIQLKNYDIDRKEWKWERTTLPLIDTVARS